MPPGRPFGPLLLVLLATIAATAAAAPAQAGELRVRATLEPERIGLDETATFTIEVHGGGLSRPRFVPDFELDNLEIVGGPYQHEDIRLGTGLLARSFRITWRLRAITTGRARVRDLRIRLAGEVVPISDREIQVQEEPAGLGRRAWEEPADEDDDVFGRTWVPWRQPKPRSADVFLRARVEPERPVVGQQVLYTVHLYTRDDITAVTTRSVPSFRGFWAHDVPQPQNMPADMVEVGGERYGRVVLLQKALFPLRPGAYTLEPTEMDVMVRTVERGFFGPPVSHSQQAHLRTPALQVNVRPLPPAPAGYTGAVGQMKLAARVEPAELRLGEAATVTVTLSGRGNLQSLPEPALSEAPGLTILPPQQQGDSQIVGAVVGGHRSWSYVVVPEKAGKYTLEAPAIPFYDPEGRRYRTASAPPIRIVALPRAAAGPGSGAPHSIRTAVSSPPAAGWARRWPQLLPWLFALPWVAALVLTLTRRSSGSAQEEAPAAPVPARSARHRLEHKLREAEADDRPRQAAARIEEAWREFLADRWEIPPGTPSTRWAGLLEERGVAAEAAGELVRLADDLHYLRYAPQLSNCEILCGEILARCRKLVRRVS